MSSPPDFACPAACISSRVARISSLNCSRHSLTEVSNCSICSANSLTVSRSWSNSFPELGAEAAAEASLTSAISSNAASTLPVSSSSAASCCKPRSVFPDSASNRFCKVAMASPWASQRASKACRASALAPPRPGSDISSSAGARSLRNLSNSADKSCWSCCRNCANSLRSDSSAGACATSTRSASAAMRVTCPSTFTRIFAKDSVRSSTFAVTLSFNSAQTCRDWASASSTSPPEAACCTSGSRGGAWPTAPRASSATAEAISSVRSRSSRRSSSSTPQRSSITRKIGLSSDLLSASICLLTVRKDSRSPSGASSRDSDSSCNAFLKESKCMSNSRRSCVLVCAMSARKDSTAGSCAFSMRSASTETRSSWVSTLTRRLAWADVSSSIWPVRRFSNCDTFLSDALNASSNSSPSAPGSPRPPGFSSAPSSKPLPWESSHVSCPSACCNAYISSKRILMSWTSRSWIAHRSSRFRIACTSSDMADGACRRLKAATSACAWRRDSRNSSAPSDVSCKRSRMSDISPSSSRRSCTILFVSSLRSDSSAGAWAVSRRSESVETRCNWPSTFTRMLATTVASSST
mmetsp:Transcript_100269/g.289509  ORF Transcript_100269/g.289509 Transcript_100269/m.289509 type:complete len:581 (-) Transcript_100269:1088-2830(-)